jgi:hypothetical protein
MLLISLVLDWVEGTTPPALFLPKYFDFLTCWCTPEQPHHHHHPAIRIQNTQHHAYFFKRTHYT